MALSLDALYKPLNDFFVSKFGSPAGSEVLFRFDKLGSVISDSDFIDENHPEAGYQSALAREKFSDLVNRVPVDCADGLNVSLSQNSIDDTYFYRLLSPAVPWIPAGSDDQVAESCTNTFNLEKAKALQLWNNTTMESISGLMMQYKPSLATPEVWYDSTNADVWTVQKFEISEPAAAEPDGPPADVQMWKLAPSAQLLAAVVDPPPQVDPPGAADPPEHPEWTLRSRLQEMREHPEFEMAVARAEPVRISPALREARMMPLAGLSSVSETRAASVTNFRLALSDTDVTVEASPVVVAAAAAAAPAAAAEPPAYDLSATFDRQVRSLDIRDRLLISGVISQDVPTEPAKTSSVRIAFDYCLVTVNRPWLFDVFVNGGNWCLPGTEKGAFTKGNTPGAISLLPIGMVAVRNLEITADWDPDDVANSELATAFGPFKIDGGVVDGSLRHKSIQTIGWLLQQLPDLPPQQFGAPAAPGPQDPAEPPAP